MKWKGRAGSSNVRDTRRTPGKKVAVGGGLLVIILGIVGALMGKDLSFLTSMLSQSQAGGGQQTQDSGPTDPRKDALLEFSSVVLKDTEDIWHDLLDNGSQKYREPVMNVFRDSVNTACGNQSSAVGPFYCPGDSTVYLELGFFDLLEKKLGAKGDFARAYVIAHEVGHHIQNLTGYSDMVHKKKQTPGISEAEKNGFSVRLELQADFLAGIYAHHAEKRGYLERGDVEEALNAASQIGDDVLTKRATGRVGPSESFTHGTGEQRVRWFRLGYKTGDPSLMSRAFEVSDREL